MDVFKINNGILNNKSWLNVDKNALIDTLQDGLKNGASGAREAVKEMFAVAIGDDAKEWWGPHHVINKDGSLVANQSALMEAASELQKSRDKLGDKYAEAELHLKRHFEEFGMQWPEEQPVGEMISLQANITSEIDVQDIPLAPGVDLAAIKAGDTDPLEVVVEISPGKSKRGWNYLPTTLQKIVRQVATGTAAGFLGHQKPENLNYEFKEPVTHWVGAIWKDGKAYFRGVVDKVAPDLKRWIRSRRIQQVSIYGETTLNRTKDGSVEVVDYNLYSIDWTPLDRNGMPTRVVATGEMDVINSGGENNTNNKFGGAQMNLQELLAELKKLGVSPRVVIGEMGWKLEQIAGEIAADTWANLQAQAKIVGEMAKTLNVEPEKIPETITGLQQSDKEGKQLIGEMFKIFGMADNAKGEDLIKAAKEAQEAVANKTKESHNQLVNKVIGEMVTAEAARPIVKRMANIPVGTSEDEIKKIVGEMLADEEIKKSLAGIFKNTSFIPANGGSVAPPASGGLTVRKTAI